MISDSSGGTYTDNVTRIRTYFREFLPGLVNQLLLEDLEGLSCCFEISVDGTGDRPWQLVVENGRLVYVGHDGGVPVCQYKTDVLTALAVAAADETPQAAFFDQRIQLIGDMEMGLTLSTVLEPFFRRFPYRG